MNRFPWDGLVSPVLFVHPSGSCAAGRCLVMLWYQGVELSCSFRLRRKRRLAQVSLSAAPVRAAPSKATSVAMFLGFQ